MQSDTDSLPPLRERVAQACDTCKQRKVKCDGQIPCGYCKRRRRAHTCHFSPAIRRRRRRSEQPTRASPSPSVAGPPSTHIRPATPAAAPTHAAPILAASASAAHVSPTLTAEEEAEVPFDARLICDAQGRLAFIGDCAPLSLFQTVRQIVTSMVDPHAFTPETSRVSMLENISSEGLVPLGLAEEPAIDHSAVRRLVLTFLTVTSGLVDLFDVTTLIPEIQSWVAGSPRPADVTLAVHYLVLAIGSQCEDEQTATTYFLRGKHLALSALAGNLSLGTVQSFILTTLYMLRSCQINAAFLFFGIAARAAYAIGLHRTEVNSRFGPEIHTRRDRLWKSLRVLDLYLSQSMGRPPAAADADCTVPYNCVCADGSEQYDLLNASVQILSLVERIIWEVYSRRKISLQLTEGIARELRSWSQKWLTALLGAVEGANDHNDDEGHSNGNSANDINNGNDQTQLPNRNDRESTGAYQVLSSYYYGVMLVSRPFLMYELCRRLSEPGSVPAAESNGSGRAKLANACIDAASLMIGLISDFVERGPVDKRMPLLVSWLFASSLVVGVGLLGDFSRSLDKVLGASIRALEFFGRHDAHAAQYARIADSLRVCAVSHLEKRDTEDRRRIAEESTQLFGLLPPGARSESHSRAHTQMRTAVESGSINQRGSANQHTRVQTTRAPNPEDPLAPWEVGPFGDFDPAIFSFGEMHTPLQTAFRPPQQGEVHVHHDGADQVFGAINLFPLLDGDGHIDLAHLL